MGEGLHFSVLGPLEVRYGGSLVPLGGRRQRALLTMFLCNARQVVSQDRLLDALLPDVPMESAQRMLRVQVSRLRKTLTAPGEASRITATPPGYLLRIEDGELDADLLEDRIAMARRAATDGDLRETVEHLLSAESVWRGDPMSEFADEPFAQLEVQRLRELHDAASDQRIAAQLELGQHVLVLPELETRVAALPLRERPRAHLMVALSRSGRQVEALEAYQSFRDLLVDELGLEPSPSLTGLQRSILNQAHGLNGTSMIDVAGLDEPQATSMTPAVRNAKAIPLSRGADPMGRRLRPRGRRTRRLALVLAGCAGLATAAFTSVASNSDTALQAGTAAQMILLGPGGSLWSTIPLAAAPGSTVTAFGGVWTLEPSAGVVVRFDPETRQVVTTMPVGTSPVNIVAGSKVLWVADAVDRTVTAVDPHSDAVAQTFDVGVTPSAVAESGDAVWVASPDSGAILRVEPATGRAQPAVHLPAPTSSLAVAGGSVWALSDQAGTLTRIDPGTASVTATVKVSGAPSQVLVDGSDLWVLDPLTVTLTRIDTRTALITDTVQLSGRPTAMAAEGGSLWAADRDHGVIQRIDTRRAAVAETIHVGRTIESMTAAGGLWVATSGMVTTHRGGTLNVVTEGVLDSLDPASSTSVNWSPPQLFGLVHDTLVTLNHAPGAAGTQLVPDLALALPEPADGGLTYTFHMRQGVQYSSGSPVRPSDVPRSLERLYALHSSGARYYTAITGASKCAAVPSTCDLAHGVVADDAASTVTFHLTQPDPDFLYKLALVYASILPATTPRRESREPLPATGPYVVSSYSTKHDLTLVRNPAYREWSTAAQPNGNPDTIVIRFGVASADAASSVRSGQSDFHGNVGGVEGVDLAKVGSSDRIEVHPLLGTAALAININAPPFNDVRVRRALNLALDRNRIVAAYGGPRAASPTCQILPPGMPGYEAYCPYTARAATDGMWHGPDLPQARQLVQQSGTTGMRVTVWSTPKPHVTVAESQIAVDALNALGYRADLRILPDDTYFTYANDSRNHAQVVDGGWSADYPSANNFLGKLTCDYYVPGDGTATTDTSELCDPGYDALVAEAAALSTTDPTAANSRWAQLDRKLTDLAIWLPTVTPTKVDVLSSRVHNYQYHPLWGALIDQFWLG